MSKLRPYKKSQETSYALGATVVLELIKHSPQLLRRIFMSPDISSELRCTFELHLSHFDGLEVLYDKKAFNVLSQKENCFVIAEFKKYSAYLQTDAPHIVLVNPSNAGNLGTIIRSSVGFNNIVIIHPAVDEYDPKVVRASMGAIFNCNIISFPKIENYIHCYPQRKMLAFMLDASIRLEEICIVNIQNTTLLFGNEATGLGDEYKQIACGIRIMHNNSIDSLNLPIAVSIVEYELTRNRI